MTSPAPSPDAVAAVFGTANSPSLADPPTSALESAAEPSTAIDSPVQRPKRARKPRIVLEGTREEILARNAEAPPAPVVEKLVKYQPLHWHKFYRNHAAVQFFKDRHWTEREWDISSILDGGKDGEGEDDESERRRGKGRAVLEVGCGTGAFIYPLLEHYPGTRFCAFDFARKAVELTKEHALYNTSQVHAFQHDLTAPSSDLHDKLAASPPEFGPPPRQFDIVSSIFVLSALAPRHQAAAVKTLVSLLAPGGSLLFRDYALHDAAQLRFHSLPSASYATTPSLLSPRTNASPSAAASPQHELSAEPSSPADSVDETNRAWYKRGDNTFTYFYTDGEIQSLINEAVASLNAGKTSSDPDYIVLEGGCGIAEREMFNRAEDWGCTRRFVHGSWRRVRATAE